VSGASGATDTMRHAVSRQETDSCDLSVE